MTAAIILVVAGAVLVNRADFDRRTPSLTPEEETRRAAAKERRARLKARYALYDALQPVALANCQLQRFGEPHDGGYLMCANLLTDVQSAYSYGISGYDKWGCDVSTRFRVPVHQYDCFDTSRPVCRGGTTIFHEECVGPARETVDGRVFDSISNQIARNGDRGKRIVLKIDVEGAEWASLQSLPDEWLDRIDQLTVEFHWKHDGKLKWVAAETYMPVVQRLKQFFEIAHLHFNNAACIGGLDPFPTWAYELLFVNKRLAVVDRSRRTDIPHPLDALNDPLQPECRPPQ